MDCDYCLMSQEILPCDKLYEDDCVMVVKDSDKENPDHVRVISTKHTDEIYGNVYTVIGEVVMAAAKNGYDGVMVNAEEGEHFCVHIIPWKKGDAANANLLEEN